MADSESPAEDRKWSETGQSPTGRFILGDYGSPLVMARDGGAIPVIDVGATISALQAAHINTFAYLICPDKNADPRVSRSQWEQLPGFARSARVADIDVFVYLVPPTEALEQAYEPFHWDYVTWFDQIGRIASQERSIKGIVIDDFGGNVVSRSSLRFQFTPAYVERMTAAAHRRVPTLLFMPVLYHHDMVGAHAVLSDFRHQVQGVIFPYFGYSDGRRIRGNTWDATKALAQGLEISDLLSCPGREACHQIVFPARTRYEPITDTAVWAGKVALLPNERRLVSVSVNDDGGAMEYNNYQVQILVDGTIVGTANRGSGRNERVFDITAATSTAPTAMIELRIIRPAGMSRTRMTAQLGQFSVRGMTTDGAFDRPAQASPGVTSSLLSDIPLIVMPYAIPLTAEQGRGASPAYFQSVLRQIGVLRSQGRIAGSLVFNLQLATSGLGTSSEHYQILTRAYAQWLTR